MDDPTDHDGEAGALEGNSRVPAELLSDEPLGHYDKRMYCALVSQPGWFDSIPVHLRRLVMDKLTQSLERATKPRDVASITRALSSLERNDLARQEAQFGRADADRKHSLTVNVQNNVMSIHQGNRRELPEQLTIDELRALATMSDHDEPTKAASPRRKASPKRRRDANGRKGRKA